MRRKPFLTQGLHRIKHPWPASTLQQNGRAVIEDDVVLAATIEVSNGHAPCAICHRDVAGDKPGSATVWRMACIGRHNVGSAIPVQVCCGTLEQARALKPAKALR